MDNPTDNTISGGGGDPKSKPKTQPAKYKQMVSPGGGDETKPYSPSNPSPNFTYTKDPNTVIGKNGVTITRDQMNTANTNGMKWSDFNEYAHWRGGFDHNPKEDPSMPPVINSKSTPLPSDKAAGLSSNYYPSKGMPSAPAIPTQKRSQ